MRRKPRFERTNARSAMSGPRVLTIQQPWAWAIASGRKKVENRTWSTRYRGPVYVHAGLKCSREAAEWLRRQMRITTPADLPRGVVVAVADLNDVVTGKRATKFGKWFTGPYGFVFSNVRPLRRPVRTTGNLGLFRPSAALIRNVQRQLRER